MKVLPKILIKIFEASLDRPSVQTFVSFHFKKEDHFENIYKGSLLNVRV